MASPINFRVRRDPSGIDAKPGDRFLQADFPVLIRTIPNWITSESPTIRPECAVRKHVARLFLSQSIRLTRADGDGFLFCNRCAVQRFTLLMKPRALQARPPIISTNVATAFPRRGQAELPSILEREVFPRYCLWIWMLPSVMNPPLL
jgi:hypothetical protein